MEHNFKLKFQIVYYEYNFFLNPVNNSTLNFLVEPGRSRRKYAIFIHRTAKTYVTKFLGNATIYCQQKKV